MAQVIKSEVLQRIKADEELIFKISRHVGRSFRTVDRWLLFNSRQLQVPVVLQMIKDRFQITDDLEILESVESKVA